ncbi:hypothetical protein MPTK1_3g02740 [Marchantia polymorpha subsp. ruderalis]|uniref:Uncharacterized protein n=2 Tax=Marchantia polymorpha TaxID=3197 RepID=A0AAF6AWT2_MARPO|nr:hypothetical protein MARPO_0007s0262 [Marchantia polymorpha]BBN04216.1 hypothetical protein Mp_3g02740 [Marchantia polymorpha subsp. ruderalis]|eukprot:PTQ47901.1 hypothetical protein MARPO_0007s0262 [Marchantia polymorpha]
MQRLRIMAATCLQQIACSSLSSSRALAVVPGKVEGLRSLSTSSSVLVKPWWRQSGGLPLRTVTARPAFIATRGRFNVQAQAVSTTSETEAEAAPEATTDVTAIEAVNGDYAPSQLKTKKLTKQVKHIMNVSYFVWFLTFHHSFQTRFYFHLLATKFAWWRKDFSRMSA